MESSASCGEDSPERVAALWADMDALPVREESGVDFASTVVDDDYPGGPFPVAHSCGHDCHTAAVLASAHVLASVRDRLPGTVLFVFQPAEEGPPVGEVGGAQAMLDAGAFSDPVPTMAFGMHVGPLPKGVVGYRAGNQYAASCLVKITVTGQQVHGSAPWMGIARCPRRRRSSLRPDSCTGRFLPTTRSRFRSATSRTWACSTSWAKR